MPIDQRNDAWHHIDQEQPMPRVALRYPAADKRPKRWGKHGEQPADCCCNGLLQTPSE